MANCGGAGDCSADLFCAQEWWAWERVRETERERHCTPSLRLNFSSSAAGLRVQPDWISVGVNGKPRRGEVAKLRMVWIKPLATCNLTLCQWLQASLDTTFTNMTCGFCILAQNLCFLCKTNCTTRAMFCLCRKIKSISCCSDIWSFRANSFITSVKQQLKVFSEVHRGKKGDSWPVKSNNWDWHQVWKLYQQSLLQCYPGLTMKTGKLSRLWKASQCW